jgi:hypothetical protein
MTKRCCLVTALILSVITTTAVAQTKPSSYLFRLGAAVSFGISNMAGNHVGLGGLAGAEKRINNIYTVEAEVSYTYFTGNKNVYMNAKNKAYTLPVLAGIKAYFLPNVYASLRTGALYFLLNDMNDPQIRLAYGVATGINLPPKTKRINAQLGYTGFQYKGNHHGYATLGVAIIIN